MKFIDRLKLAVKVTLGDLPRSLFGGGLSRSVNRAGYTSIESDPFGNLVGWAAFATQKKAQRVAGIELELLKLDRSNELVNIEDHEILSLFYKANRNMTRSDFFYVLGGLLSVFGRAPIYLDRPAPNKRPTEIWPLRPDLLKTVFREDGNISHYEYIVGKKSLTMAAKDVVNVRIPDLANPHYGSSPLMTAALEINADLAAAVWNRFIIENGAEPGGVLTAPATLSDAAYSRVREQWEARHAGAQNAGKTAILEEGLKYEKTSQTQKELDFIESRKFNRDTILTLLGIPTSLINDTANRANAETAERVFLKDTIEPLMRTITDALNEFMVPEYGTELWLDFESPVNDDREVIRADHVASVNVWKTVNEIREEDNLPPLEGGDFIYRPLSDVPMIGEGAESMFMFDDTITEEEKAKIKSAWKGGPVHVLKSTASRVSKKHTLIKRRILARSYKRRELERKVAEIALAEVRKVIGGKAKVSIKLKGKKDDEEDPNGGLPEPIALERKAYLKKLPSRVRKMRGVMRRYFNDLEKEVMANLEAAGDPPKGLEGLEVKEIETKASSWINKVIFDRTKQVAAVVKITKPVYEDTVVDGGQDIATLMGVPLSDLRASDRVIKYLDEKPLFFAKEVTNTTIVALATTLKEGLANGESIGQFGDRVAEVFDMARGFRTETIARTEVGSALNFGRNTEMKEQGVEKKRWVSIFSNSREDHMDASGDIVGVDETFDVGGEELEFPQDPNGSPENVINCQCSVSPVFTR